jgi:hypothetical protein
MKESSAETDRKFQESDRMFQETKRLMKESAAETDEVIKKLSKNLGDLGNRLGEFVEYSVAPAVVRLFQLQGVVVHEVHPSVEINRDGEGIEIDLLVVNDGSLVAVECKSKLTQEHVDGHVKRMEKLKRLLPAYGKHRAFGAVATMVLSESVKNYALSKGFYVLYQNGKNVEVSNPAVEESMGSDSIDPLFRTKIKLTISSIQ